MLMRMIVCLHCHEPVTSRLVLLQGLSSNLVQMHLILTEIELSYVYVISNE